MDNETLLALVVAQAVLFAIGAGMAAQRRGASAGGYAFLGLILGPFGLLFALLSSGATRNCPKCAEEVKAAATVCRFCGHNLEPIADTGDHEPAAAETPEERDARRARDSAELRNALVLVLVLAIIGCSVLFFFTDPTPGNQNGMFDYRVYQAGNKLNFKNTSNTDLTGVHIKVEGKEIPVGRLGSHASVEYDLSDFGIQRGSRVRMTMIRCDQGYVVKEL